MTLVDANAAQFTLAECEAVIERGLATFIEVGGALARIRDARLYRGSCQSFEDYCRERWGFNRAHGYRLIEASEIAGALSPIGDTPTNESQVRELAPLKDNPGEMFAAWNAAKRIAERDHRKVTAADVRNAVAERVTPDEDATQKGGGNDGTVSEGDAGSDSEPTPATGPLDAASSDGAHSHDVGRPVPEPSPAPTSPDPGPEPQPARVTGIDGKSYAAKHDRGPEDQAAKELGQEGDVKAERLRVNFARLHAQFHKGLLALSPEHVAAAIDGDEVQWRLVEETRRQAIDWYDRVLAARSKPFTVIDGGKD